MSIVRCLTSLGIGYLMMCNPSSFAVAAATKKVEIPMGGEKVEFATAFVCI